MMRSNYPVSPFPKMIFPRIAISTIAITAIHYVIICNSKTTFLKYADCKHLLYTSWVSERISLQLFTITTNKQGAHNLMIRTNYVMGTIF